MAFGTAGVGTDGLGESKPRPVPQGPVNSDRLLQSDLFHRLSDMPHLVVAQGAATGQNFNRIDAPPPAAAQDHNGSSWLRAAFDP